MKKIYQIQMAVLLSGIAFSSDSKAELVGYDLNSNYLSSLERFVGHFNNVEDLFSSSGDGSQTYYFDSSNYSDIPSALVDGSNMGLLDNLGLVMPNEQFTFFGVVDTVNASNPTGYSEATWDFDIADISDISVAIEFAAMGDFETSDEYQINYAIDYGEFNSLFDFSAQTSLTQLYAMANGDIKNIADPLSVSELGSNVYYSLDNRFSEFTSAISEQGSNLTIQFLAKADGGTEAFGFTNMRVFGEPSIMTDPVVETDPLPTEPLEPDPELEPEIPLIEELEPEMPPLVENEDMDQFPELPLPISSPTPSPAPEVNQVPEPSSLFLMALPLLTLVRRYRNHLTA